MAAARRLPAARAAVTMGGKNGGDAPHPACGPTSKEQGTLELKQIALVAHDARKRELTDWVGRRLNILRPHALWATGTTGSQIAKLYSGLNLTRLNSGPWGGDQKVGALIAEDRIDLLVFFADPMTPQPHDVDVKALTRLATLFNVPFACNMATADLLVTSPLFDEPRVRGGWAERASAYQRRVVAVD